METNINYKEFVNQVCSKVKDIIGADYIVYPHEVVKQNDVVLQAIMISERNRPTKTMPVIYLENYYEKYKETKDLDECAEAIIEFYKGLVKKDIDEIGIEELFFNKNVKTAITVAQARGVTMLACAHNGKPVYEYTPLQVKQGVVGYGRAQKAQVQQMVTSFLNLKEVPKPDDVADALAVAICHAHANKLEKTLKNIGGRKYV